MFFLFSPVTLIYLISLTLFWRWLILGVPNYFQFLVSIDEISDFILFFTRINVPPQIDTICLEGTLWIVVYLEFSIEIKWNDPTYIN